MGIIYIFVESSGTVIQHARWATVTPRRLLRTPPARRPTPCHRTLRSTIVSSHPMAGFARNPSKARHSRRCSEPSAGRRIRDGIACGRPTSSWVCFRRPIAVCANGAACWAPIPIRCCYNSPLSFRKRPTPRPRPFGCIASFYRITRYACCALPKNDLCAAADRRFAFPICLSPCSPRSASWPIVLPMWAILPSAWPRSPSPLKSGTRNCKAGKTLLIVISRHSLRPIAENL